MDLVLIDEYYKYRSKATLLQTAPYGWTKNPEPYMT